MSASYFNGMSKILIYTDGGARGNPGPAGAGAVIAQDKKVLAEVSEYLGECTNNYAEYEAIILALQKCAELGLQNSEIELRADSKLAVEQLSGNWKVKHPSVREQFNKVQALLEHFTDIKFVHVPREENTNADALANEAMDRGK